MQTRSTKKGKKTSNSNKLFDFPVIDHIERKIRKVQNAMSKLSKSATLSSSMFENEDPTSYEKIITSTITFPKSTKQTNDELSGTSGFETPPPLPPKPSEKPPPKPPRSTMQHPPEQIEKKIGSFALKLKHFARTAIICFLFVILLLSAIGGLCVIYQKYQTHIQSVNQEESIDNHRYQAIVLDKKTMTYKFTNLQIN